MKRIILAGTGLALAAAACHKAAPPPVYIAVPVARRDIVVTASAAGAVQPILTITVKSQASGEVTQMAVQTGAEVHKGELLALIDPRLPKSALDQAQATVAQAQAQLDYASAQLAREDTLYRAKAETEQNYQSAKVAYEQARASLVNAQSNLSDAQIAYDQTRVTAPFSGTILTKSVDIGTVIASTTHDVSGGTSMFTMANLDTVQVQAMVDETDIAKIRPGLPVTITADAFPNRPFQGFVLKIEPQATVNQNVTQFPVDVNILNPGHLLKPGMNTEVEIHVGDRPNVLAVPTSALRTPQDVASAAGVLGLDPSKVQDEIAAQLQRPAGDTAKTASLGGTVAKDSATAGGTMTMPDGRQVKLPAGVTAAQVQAVFAKMRSGGFGALTDADRQVMRALREANGGFGGRGGAGGRGGQMGGAEGTDHPTYVVFVLRHGQPTPVVIGTGLSDLDYMEVTSGLTAQDTVLVLPSASLVQAQQNFKSRIQNFTGGGLPGVRQQAPAGGARSR